MPSYPRLSTQFCAFCRLAQTFSNKSFKSHKSGLKANVYLNCFKKGLQKITRFFGVLAYGFCSFRNRLCYTA